MLINVPIESLDERYSAQWNKWFPQQFSKLGVDYYTVYPEPYCNSIRQGQFLDVVGTNIFKARQIGELLQLVDTGKILDGDVLFFHDLWFPGLESLFYVRDALKIDFKIVGILHAGSYDPNDYLAQCGMERWAEGIESSWFKEVDHIFLATAYHRDLLRKGSRIDLNKVSVTGLPMFFHSIPGRKENIIVFPHRLAPEKAPEEFDKLISELRHSLPDWLFVKTKDVTTTKQEYYELLAKSKVAISCAKQETWGIAQQEAVFSGCVPIVPDRLSYAELYPDVFKYRNSDELLTKVVEFATRYNTWVSSKDFLVVKERLAYMGSHAISAMVRSMQKKGWAI